MSARFAAMKSYLRSVLRRGWIAYIGAKIVLMPLFLIATIESIYYRGPDKPLAVEFFELSLFLSLPFYAANQARILLRRPDFECYRRELRGDSEDSSKPE